MIDSLGSDKEAGRVLRNFLVGSDESVHSNVNVQVGIAANSGKHWLNLAPLKGDQI